MFKLGQLWRAIRVLVRDPVNGDALIMQWDACGGQPTREARARLEAVRDYFPPIELSVLRTLPEGSFGREYARHLDANAIQPIQISGALPREVRKNVFAIRYIRTHDILHVLLGFDTTLSGEIGVLAFATGQRYCRILPAVLGLFMVVYPLVVPRQILRIFANVKRGVAAGRSAKFVLNYRFEDHWDRALDELRGELALPAVAIGRG